MAPYPEQYWILDFLAVRMRDEVKAQHWLAPDTTLPVVASNSLVCALHVRSQPSKCTPQVLHRKRGKGTVGLHIDVALWLCRPLPNLGFVESY